MSKGHMEALAALKAMRANGVTKSSVTKHAAPVGPMAPSERRDGVGSIPASGSKSKSGRPKVHASRAQKQKAYRDRKKAKA